MEKYQTINEFVASNMSDKIVQKAKSPLMGLIILAVGIGSLVLLGTQKMSDSLSATCLTMGIICTAVGFILTAMCLSKALGGYVYLPTGSHMKQRKCYLSNSDYKLSLEAINNNNIAVIGSIQPVVSSNSAIDVLYSRDHAIALLQAGRYEGNNFVPETPVQCIIGADVTHIQTLCK